MADELLEQAAPEEVVENADVGSESEAEPVVESENREQQGEELAQEGAQFDDKLPLWKQPAIKTKITELQKENPTLAAKVKAALIADSQLRKDLPEGIKPLVELRNKISELADSDYEGATPEQMLEYAKNEVTFWREFDSQISAGDPQVLDKLYEVSPDAFFKLVPAALDKFSDVNPDGFSSYISNVVLSDMSKSDIPVQFSILRAFLPKLPDGEAKDEVINAINAIYGWSQKFGELSKKPVIPASKQVDKQPDIEQQRAEIERQKVEVTRQQWNTESVPYGVNMLQTEAQKIAGKNKLSDQQMSQIGAKVAEEIEIRQSANQEYGKAMRAFLQSGNKEAYKRRLHSEYQKLIPGAVRRAYDDVIGSQKQPAKVVAQKPTVQKPVVKKDASGEQVSHLSSYPKDKIDVVRTSNSMLSERKAYLKKEFGGQLVTWSRHA